MDQFSYRPPSAGRSLIRNSQDVDDDDHDDDEEDEKKVQQKVVEQKELIVLKTFIFSFIKDFLY